MKKIISFTVCICLLLGCCVIPANAANLGWTWPVPSSNSLSSCFDDGRNHNAIDISAPKGSTVVSAYAGKVIATYTACTHNYGKNSSCGCGGDLGNYIFILSTCNGENYVSRYGHLSTVNVSVGQNVSKGQTIGAVGSTGYSTGFHLDYQIYIPTSGNNFGKSRIIDPLMDGFLQIPSGLNANAATTSCCYDYVRQVLAKENNTPHTCNKGEYVYYWKAHPHPNCYRCSICGEIWVDTSSSRYVADCEGCNTITVTTKAAVDITETTAGLPGSYYNPGSKTISEYGAKFGTPKNNLSRTASLSRNESYKNGGIPAYVVRNLTPGTTYYYRSYVVSGGKTYYGDILSFTTKEKASMWADGIAYPYLFSEGDCGALIGNIQSNNGIKWVFVGISHEKDVNADNAVQWVSDDVWKTGPTNNYPVHELASALKSYLLEPGEYWISVQGMDDDNNYYHVFDYPFTVLSVEKDTYPVSYDANGGKGAPSSQTKVKGEALTLSSTIPTSTRTIAFDLNGGNINGSTADYLMTFPATFSCWTTPVASDGSFSKYYPGASYTKDAPLSLTAYWSDILEEHLPPATPTREGYFFSGWYTNPACTAWTSHIGEDMTFYARWTKSDTTDVHFPKNTQYTQGQFTDVPPYQWFTENVAEAVEFGLMKGNSSSTFQPYGDVTLAQAITMAARIHSIYTTGSESFVQAPGLSWYQVYLDYAYHHGIIDYNYYAGDVQQKATRAQFAEIFANALPEQALPAKNNVSDGSIPDVSMQAPYASAVYRLYRAGILAGSDANGTFSPLSYITRAEAAAVVSRMADSDNRMAFSL